MRKALLAKATPHGVLCTLCEKLCSLRDGMRAPCGVRECVGGELYTRASDRVARAVRLPVESLDLYHVLPGSSVLSVACGESAIEGLDPASDVASTDSTCHAIADLPDVARKAGCSALAFGSVEPTWFLETVLPALDAARARGLLALIQTNGSMSDASLPLLASSLDGASVTVPTLHESTAHRLGTVRPHVLRENLARLRERGVWIEVTTVLQPGVNDTERELLEIALSLEAIDGTLPWHVRCAEHAFGEREAARAVGRALDAGTRAGLEYVYAASAPGADRELTFCHVCGDVVLIERFLGEPRSFLVDGIRCPSCATRAHGLFAGVGARGR